MNLVSFSANRPHAGVVLNRPVVSLAGRTNTNNDDMDVVEFGKKKKYQKTKAQKAADLETKIKKGKKRRFRFWNIRKSN